MMIRAFCALLCLSTLSSCNTSSAGNLLMAPFKLGKGILNMAGRTLGRVVEADSQAPNPETEALPKPHTRLPEQRGAGANAQTAAQVVIMADEEPST